MADVSVMSDTVLLTQLFVSLYTDAQSSCTPQTLSSLTKALNQGLSQSITPSDPLFTTLEISRSPLITNVILSYIDYR
jgi:hypothetical protein